MVIMLSLIKVLRLRVSNSGDWKLSRYIESTSLLYKPWVFIAGKNNWCDI